MSSSSQRSNASLSRRVGVLVGVVGLCLAGAAGGADNYIGAKRCQGCHEEEYRIWADGPHATAHESLGPEQLKDPRCSTCHTMAPEKMEPLLLGVQCERCHGAGKYYHRDYVMRDQELARAVGLVEIKEAHCRQCHTPGTPNVVPFDFVAMWQDIAHGSEAGKEPGGK